MNYKNAGSFRLTIKQLIQNNFSFYYSKDFWKLTQMKHMPVKMYLIITNSTITYQLHLQAGQMSLHYPPAAPPCWPRASPLPTSPTYRMIKSLNKSPAAPARCPGAPPPLTRCTFRMTNCPSITYQLHIQDGRMLHDSPAAPPGWPGARLPLIICTSKIVRCPSTAAPIGWQSAPPPLTSCNSRMPRCPSTTHQLHLQDGQVPLHHSTVAQLTQLTLAP